MSERPKQLAILLFELEAELRKQNFWEAQAPPEEALQSIQPFCVDTLAFHEWLQFVFIPKLHQMITLGMPLPTQCAVRVMAEEAFKEHSVEVVKVLELLGTIDELISEE